MNSLAAADPAAVVPIPLTGVDALDHHQFTCLTQKRMIVGEHDVELPLGDDRLVHAVSVALGFMLLAARGDDDSPCLDFFAVSRNGGKTSHETGELLQRRPGADRDVLLILDPADKPFEIAPHVGYGCGGADVPGVASQPLGYFHQIDLESGGCHR